MKLLVAGARDKFLSDDGYKYLDELHNKYHFDLLVNGCAAGIDSCAQSWAYDNRIMIAEFPARWEEYGRSAGPRRNREMIACLSKGDIVVVFSGGRGTLNLLYTAKQRPDIKIFNMMDQRNYIID